MAWDVSPEALAVATANASTYSLEIEWSRKEALQEEAWSDLSGLDLIISNPPYIAMGDPHLTRGDLRFEPQQALVSGIDGLDAIRHIVDTAPAYLEPGAWLWLEHGADQGGRVAALLRQRGFGEVRSHRDLAGHDRHCGGRFDAPGPHPGRGSPP